MLKYDIKILEAQATAVFDSLKEWKLMTSICFDTTASNIGVRSGACVLLEKKLRKKLVNR